MPAGGLLRGFSKHRALVLDSSYRPINTVNWFKAVCMDMAGKVDVIRYYDAYEPSAYRLHQLPAVMVVRHFVDIKEVRALLGSCCCAGTALLMFAPIYWMSAVVASTLPGHSAGGCGSLTWAILTCYHTIGLAHDASLENKFCIMARPYAYLAAVGCEHSWNLAHWKLSPAHHALQMSAKVALTRRNIMIRDRFCCQYCGSKRNLTLDHVHPQSKGGRNTWCNLVTACMGCNQKKGSRWGAGGWACQCGTSPRNCVHTAG